MCKIPLLGVIQWWNQQSEQKSDSFLKWGHDINILVCSQKEDLAN